MMADASPAASNRVCAAPIIGSCAAETGLGDLRLSHMNYSPIALPPPVYEPDGICAADRLSLCTTGPRPRGPSIPLHLQVVSAVCCGAVAPSASGACGDAAVKVQAPA